MLTAKDDPALYNYNLKFIPNLDFCIHFGILTIYQFVLIIRQYTTFKKTIPKKINNNYIWSLTPFFIGFSLEFIGYIFRLFNVNDNTLLIPFIIQAVCIVLAPAFMSASLYMNVGQIIKIHEAERFFIVPIKWCTRIFVTGDILAIFLQSTGSSFETGTIPLLIKIGRIMFIVGLFVQIVFFGVFLVTTANFTYKYYYNNILEKPNWVKSGYYSRDSWIFMISGLFLCSILIQIRSIYRVVEYLQGPNGILLSSEVYLFLLDSSIVIIAGIVYLGIDISNNLSKIYLRKQFREEHELLNTNNIDHNHKANVI